MEMRESEIPKIIDSLSIKSEETDDIAENVNLNENILGKTELTLCKHNLHDLSNEFFRNFNNLIKLDLSDNDLRELPESICLLKKLEKFIVDRNNIQQLPDVIIHLENLNEFSVSGNCLYTLPKNMEELNKLQILNLSDNNLKCLPDSWVKMNNLITLDISENSFVQIPNCLREGMLGIQSLNVSKNAGMNINAEIFSRNLRKFYAKYNGGINTTFPKWIWSEKFLEIHELVLEGTYFGSINIPISGRKRSLKKLNLKDCKLYDTVLEKILDNISSVEHLDIGNAITRCSGNAFLTIPVESFRNPQKLISMSINNTGLSDITMNIQLFTNLTTINLHGNNLTWLPEGICNLTKLQVLDISSNTMIMLPQNLGSMTSLKILKAATNNISSLPPSITNLRDLEWLDLFENDFTEMPEEIGRLTNLRAFDLEYNYFTTVDIVLPPNYLDLRSQVRLMETHRSSGPRIIDTETISSYGSSYTQWNDSNNAESISGDSNRANEAIVEENWDVTDEFADEFDPFDPPPVAPPRWDTSHVFFHNKFNFCPADLHARRTKDIIAEERVNGWRPLLPIVEGQFDDIE